MSTATAAISDCSNATSISRVRKTVKAHTRQFKTASLYNVLPSDLTSERVHRREQCRLFQGDVFVEELLNVNEFGNVDHVPSYQLKFGWNHSPSKLFCETEIIDNIHKMNEVMKTWGSYRFRIMMQCSMNRYVLLELKFSDSSEDRRFRDLICRINDEFEILAELMWD